MQPSYTRTYMYIASRHLHHTRRDIDRNILHIHNHYNLDPDMLKYKEKVNTCTYENILT